jgi:DNA-binding transcriptional ArsR family regulator
MATKTTRRGGGPGRTEPEPAQEFDAAVQTAELVEAAEEHTQASAAEREKELREFANVFALLSDETRLRILAYLLQNGELNVTDLCNRLGQTQPAVSHHLALLRVAGLIEARRSGKNNFYSVRTDHFSELFARMLSLSGEMPKKLRFHNFTLSYQGR